MRILLSVTFFAVILFQCFSSTGQNGKNYPAYQEVLKSFFKNYSVADIPGTSQLRFEKRPDGWHAVVIDYSSGQTTIKNGLYWDRKKSEYTEIDFTKTSTPAENAEILERYLNDWSVQNFIISPYYGYPGWDMDVINDYKNAKGLSDTTLYALGRAYSSYASNLLNNNSGLADTKDMFQLPEGKNSMTPEQLAKYRMYRHAAIEKFNELASKNPGFETIVGSISVKASNEYLTSFLELITYQNEEEAMKELPDGLYNDFYIAFAKNYLQSCPRNAILYTNGDNDTYPLLYVQAKQNFRRDVLVVNLSLLQTDRYINMIREPVMNNPGLSVTFTKEQISGTKRDVVIVNSIYDDRMELTDLINFIKDDKNQLPFGGAEYFYIPTKNLSLKLDDKRIEFSLNNQYFFRNQLIFYDILANEKMKRPVCFAISVSDDYLFGLNDYMQLNGLVYQIIPDKMGNSEYGLGSVNTDYMYDFITKKFDAGGLNKVDTYEKLPCMNYRNIHYRLAEALINENRLKDAELILDKGTEIIPDNMVFYDVFMIPYIDYYYKIGKFSKGNSLAKIVISNLKNNRNSFSDHSFYNRERTNSDDLELIRQLAEKYEQKEILKEFE